MCAWQLVQVGACRVFSDTFEVEQFAGVPIGISPTHRLKMGIHFHTNEEETTVKSPKILTRINGAPRQTAGRRCRL